MKLIGKYLVWLKKLWLKLHLGPIMNFCKDCGVQTEPYWVTDDKIWLKVADTKTNILCYQCFGKRARERNIATMTIVEGYEK